MNGPSAEGPRSRFRHLDPPIAPEQMTESVDVSTPPELPDDGYREQEWLIRNALW